VVRLLVCSDLYYLLVRVCKRVDMLNEFAFARCREVEAAPNGYVDLWAREHFKSSIITFGLTIQDILKDPEITFGLFSHTRPIAKAFLRQIMRELEENKTLKAAFPDVLWEDVRQAPKWSEDDGIIVKRSRTRTRRRSRRGASWTGSRCRSTSACCSTTTSLCRRA
jgi:hypothetical protein